MSMSTFVEAYKPPDEKWRAMKSVWDACARAEVDPPDEVLDFFEEEKPDKAGVRIDHFKMEKAGIIKEWGDDGRSGYELDLEKLPEGVKVLRFYNSW